MTPGEVFPFAADRSMRRWSRAFLVHPEICVVQLSAAQLTASFGRWSLSTPVSNIADVTITGPYARWKVAGPAHLTVGDRGVTFATTADRGVCLSFHRPVPAIDPLGVIKHPNATLTVADPERFAAAVRAAMDGAHEPTDAAGEGAAGPGRGTYRGSALALLRWTRRGVDSVTHDRRDVEHIAVPYPDAGPVELVQRFGDGVGPAFHRTYSVVVDGGDADARTAITRMQRDLNAVSNQQLSPINKVAGELGVMRVGDRYVVALAGPWSGPIGVVAVHPDCFRVVTLEGHLEAGTIEFRTADRPDGGLDFTIESWAHSGDHALRFLYDLVGPAQALQSEMWVEMCEAVVRLVGGTQRGPVQVLTERAPA